MGVEQMLGHLFQCLLKSENWWLDWKTQVSKIEAAGAAIEITFTRSYHSL